MSNMQPFRSWPSPAKINLFLHINHKRPDNYHELQTLFQLLDYGDTINIRVLPTSTIQLNSDIQGVNQEDNLIYRAAKLLQQTSQTTQGCEITLDKRLPMGGGLGGGSSNAATTLLALNHMWQLKLSIHKLTELGLQLGADVPIFIHGHTAFAEGIGEKITPTPLPTQYYLIVNPCCHVSTKAIFEHPELPRTTPKINRDDYSFAQTHNDCQKVVCKMYPNIANTLHWLIQYAPSRMTGTGACLFAIFNTEEQATQVMQQLPDGANGFVAKGVNISPLHRLLNAP